MMNQSKMMSMSQSHSQQVMNNQNSQMLMNNQLINPSQMMNQSQSQLMLNNSRGGGGGGGYGAWPPAQLDQFKFKNQNMKPSGYNSSNNKNWKVRKGNNDKWNNNNNWKEVPVSINNNNKNNNSNSNLGYIPPTLKELQQQNRLKARRYISKKKFNHGGKSAPFAPRNTTSFLIRAKKSGGITSLVSPCPVTPAVLPTPIFSPSREVLVDMAKEEWGVDGYGSMKGLIRLRSPGNDDDEEGGSSGSDVEEHVEVERRLDHDLSRFEMIYPNYGGVGDHIHSSYHLENRVDDQDNHIARLDEENIMLKERLFFMERKFSNLRTRLQSLELQRQGSLGFAEEVVVENDSENDSGSRGYGRSVEDNNNVELIEENNEGSKCCSDASDNGEKGLQGLKVLEGVDNVDFEATNKMEEDDHVRIEAQESG